MAKIFSTSVRAGVSRLSGPVAHGLLRMGISPNAVTVAGTVGVVACSIGFGARGHLVAGTVAVTLFALTDVIDGEMARRRGGSSRFGALLDSACDRIADGAVFGSVAYWLGSTGDRPGLVAALICLLAGQVVSYVKARAEGLGMTCDVGIAERAERLILVGIGGLATGFGLDWGLPAVLWLLAVLSVITIGQRIGHVYRQARAAGDPGVTAGGAT